MCCLRGWCLLPLQMLHSFASDLLGAPLDFTAPIAQLLHVVRCELEYAGMRCQRSDHAQTCLPDNRAVCPHHQNNTRAAECRCRRHSRTYRQQRCAPAAGRPAAASSSRSERRRHPQRAQARQLQPRSLRGRSRQRQRQRQRHRRRGRASGARPVVRRPRYRTMRVPRSSWLGVAAARRRRLRARLRPRLQHGGLSVGRPPRLTHDTPQLLQFRSRV
jgi:hypothetical protein